jgi:two-component system nitrate/nitrite response regulator NarL
VVRRRTVRSVIPMTRVLIVASIRIYREGLAELLRTANDEFAVVGTESTGREAVERVDETSPDVTLVDMDVPDLGDISTAFATRSPRIPLVAIGVTDSDSEVLACAEMGIAGYVTRDSSIIELTAALRGAADGDGELICSPRTAGILMRRVAELAADRPRNGGCVDLLTHREREVAKLMCEDLSNKEIASRLCIEVATVKNHVHNVLDKLNVHRRSEVVRLLARTANGFAR